MVDQNGLNHEVPSPASNSREVARVYGPHLSGRHTHSTTWPTRAQVFRVILDSCGKPCSRICEATRHTNTKLLHTHTHSLRTQTLEKPCRTSPNIANNCVSDSPARTGQQIHNGTNHHNDPAPCVSFLCQCRKDNRSLRSPWTRDCSTCQEQQQAKICAERECGKLCTHRNRSLVNMVKSPATRNLAHHKRCTGIGNRATAS